MWKHVNWNPDREELRRFALAMLIGFGILGALAAWRMGGVGPRSVWLWGAGLSLALAASAPGLGRIAYLAVYLPAGTIGWVVSHVLLVGVLYGVFTPIGILMRLAGNDPLLLRLNPDGTAWKPARAPGSTENYYRQF